MSFFPELVGPFRELIEETHGRRVAVVGHARPDGDCIGSQVGLCRVLRARGVDAVCVNVDPVPRRLQFLVGDTPFTSLRDFLSTSGGGAGWNAIFTDCADHARAGRDARRAFAQPLGNIDHHLSNDGFATHNILDGAAAATAEVLAGLFADTKTPMDAHVAQALYVGIATDTGQFRFPSTTRRAFELTARLMDHGANPAEASEEVYERESFEKLELLGRFLESLKRECDGRVCIGILSARDFEQTGANQEDTEGLVDYARAIDGVDIGVLIEERADGFKASLRAKQPAMRVDQIAAGFGGGGHACAAGLNVPATMADSLRPKLIEAISARFAELAAVRIQS
ncbi:MAG TPA: DHH family phosphoesterase [Opitutaceae bacterium]